MPDTTPTLRDRLTRALDECRTMIPAAQADVVLSVLRKTPDLARQVLGTTDQQPETLPADRRERYAAAIREADGWVLDDGQHMVDAVMAVADADRAAVLREAASSVESSDVAYNTEAATAALTNGGPFALIAFVQLAIGAHLRRMADEAKQPEAHEHVWATVPASGAYAQLMGLTWTRCTTCGQQPAADQPDTETEAR